MASHASLTFISYSPEDREFALKLATDLKAMGVNVWLDLLDIMPGESWGGAIETALDAAAQMLVILSPAFVRSTTLEVQVGHALETGKRVMPILWQDCKVPARIRRLRYVDFRTGYAGGMTQLLNILEQGNTAGSRSRANAPSRLKKGTSKRKRAKEQPSAEEEPQRRTAGERVNQEEVQPRKVENLKEESLLEHIMIENREKEPELQRRENWNFFISYCREHSDPGMREDLDKRLEKILVDMKQTGESSFVPHAVSMDNVLFTLTGPSVLAPGSAHELLFWVHIEEQKPAVLTKAATAHGLPLAEIFVKSEGPYPLERGSRVSIRLKIKGVKCPDAYKWITWSGDIGNTSFVVDVPLNTAEGAYSGSASIRLNGCEIAKMSFVVYIGKASTKIAEIPSSISRHRRAFASYASEDRAEVLSRIQGMEAAYKGLRVFIDIANLRSGQNWERELRDHISTSDVFYLFWCRHALASEWVSKEWHLALSTKGADFIDPVPLENPELAPPPHELAAKHFNDPLLAFIAAAGGGHA